MRGSVRHTHGVTWGGCDWLNLETKDNDFSHIRPFTDSDMIITFSVQVITKLHIPCLTALAPSMNPSFESGRLQCAAAAASAATERRAAFRSASLQFGWWRSHLVGPHGRLYTYPGGLECGTVGPGDWGPVLGLFTQDHSIIRPDSWLCLGLWLT